MENAPRTLAVVMQRRNARSRWTSVIWEPVSVLESEEPAGPARLLINNVGNRNHWIGVRVLTKQKRDALGARVAIVRGAEPGTGNRCRHR